MKLIFPCRIWRITCSCFSQNMNGLGLFSHFTIGSMTRFKVILTPFILQITFFSLQSISSQYVFKPAEDLLKWVFSSVLQLLSCPLNPFSVFYLFSHSFSGNNNRPKFYEYSLTVSSTVPVPDEVFILACICRSHRNMWVKQY